MEVPVERPHLRSPKRLRQNLRAHHPIFERVAQAGRRLRAVGKHPPLPIRRPAQVNRVVMQKYRLRHGQPVTSAEKAGIVKDQFRRQRPIAQQSQWTVNIGQHQVEQRGALLDGGFNGLPFDAVEHQRDRVHRPRTLLPLRIAVDIERNAIGLDDLPALLPAARELPRTQARHRIG